MNVLYVFGQKSTTNIRHLKTETCKKHKMYWTYTSFGYACPKCYAKGLLKHRGW